MQDFRDLLSYKSFEICQPNRDKFQNVLRKLDSVGLKNMAQVKTEAIDAMAFNESCLNLSKSFDLSTASPNLRDAFASAQLAYKARVTVENNFLSAIITENHEQLGKSLSASLVNVVIEQNKFSLLSEIPKDQPSFHVPGFVVIIFAVIIAAGLRGYLKKDKVESVGVVRYSLGIFGGLFSGIKDEARSMREMKKRNKDDV